MTPAGPGWVGTHPECGGGCLAGESPTTERRLREHMATVHDLEGADADPYLRRADDVVGAAAEDAPTGLELPVESWREFAQAAGEQVPSIVTGLWPEGALGFVASPPKRGKTWVGLGLGLSVASGRAFLEFEVPRPRVVLYVALEGHRAALRARIGCLARGLGLNPDSDTDLERFHLAYRPRGMNLADPRWSEALVRRAAELKADLVIVDVLRAAARIRENAAEDFATLRANLAPLLDAGVSLAFLHHFAKASDQLRDRDPGERMSGSGAMFGALDVGLFITGAENGARRFRLEFEGRDLAAPAPIDVALAGQGSGDNGGFTYKDSCQLVRDGHAASAEATVKGPAEEIADWIREHGGQATPGEIRKRFSIGEETLRRRRDELQEHGIAYTGAGRRARYVALDPATANPATIAGNASRGQERLKTDERPRDPANPAIDASRDEETGDMQGKPLPRDPAPPTEEAPSSRGASSPKPKEAAGADLAEENARASTRGAASEDPARVPEPRSMPSGARSGSGGADSLEELFGR